MPAQAPFLVNRGDSNASRSVAKQFARAARDRVELRLAAPLPCHSFISGEGTPVRTAECGMGLITGLPTLPMAPVRALGWMAEKPNITAERELHDPGVLRAQHAVPNQELGDRDISQEEFEREEERLIERLHTARGCSPAE
ncbi:gas vesicle protein GvpG [Streptomyces sp. NPDC058695]|uniref:gas vesicle protein GvpG n=1 Tax=Streptomyces sp. NPDC058695 TaxID=3346604 RepID=UPI00365CCD0C